MLRRVIFPLLSLVLLSSSNSAHASLLYVNPPDLSNTQNGDCSFNAICSTTFFVAQEFSLASSATITGGGYNGIQGGGAGNSVNYVFYTVDSVTGLPGVVLASGTSPFTTSAGPTGVTYSTEDNVFDVTPLSLSAGSYYLAIQHATGSFDFLSFGAGSTGGADSSDGGVTYHSGYDVTRSAAISVYGTSSVPSVPEPNSIYLLGSGLVGVTVLRRRFSRA
jgi:hypothetical protein